VIHEQEMERKQEEHLQQAMQEMEMKLAKKSSLVKSYELALKATAQQLDQLADISERRLRIKDAADRGLANPARLDPDSSKKCNNFRSSDVTATGGGELLCRVLEQEITHLEETERQLMIRNNCLEGALSAREQRIAELEELVRRKEREIEDNRSIVDAKERRIQKLRLKLSASCSTRPQEVSSDHVNCLVEEHQGSEIPKQAVASAAASAFSALAMQVQSEDRGSERNNNNTFFAPRPGDHKSASPAASSPLKESMRHAYEEAQAALQQNHPHRPRPTNKQCKR
jgi:hypothetical protein